MKTISIIEEIKNSKPSTIGEVKAFFNTVDAPQEVLDLMIDLISKNLSSEELEALDSLSSDELIDFAKTYKSK